MMNLSWQSSAHDVCYGYALPCNMSSTATINPEYFQSPRYLRSLKLSWVSEVYNQPPPAGGILYHYTKLESVEAIIGSHTFRATWNRVMNDSSEQIFGTNMLKETLLMRLREQGTIATVDVSTLRDQIHYLSSFCDDGDLLSMWSRYGGFCIGFDASELRLLGVPDTDVRYSVPLLAPVSYGHVPACIDAMIRNFLKHPAALKVGIGELIDGMAPFMASMIKDLGFREEREWRLIVRSPRGSRTKIALADSGPRPYVEMRYYGLLPIRVIRIAKWVPQRDEDRLRGSLRKHYSHVRVERSDIPLPC